MGSGERVKPQSYALAVEPQEERIARLPIDEGILRG
jgi:hypothetical protein